MPGCSKCPPCPHQNTKTSGRIATIHTPINITYHQMLYQHNIRTVHQRYLPQYNHCSTCSLHDPMDTDALELFSNILSYVHTVHCMGNPLTLVSRSTMYRLSNTVLPVVPPNMTARCESKRTMQWPPMGGGRPETSRTASQQPTCTRTAVSHESKYTARDNDPVIVCATIVSTSDCLSVSVNQIDQLIEYAIPGHVATVHGNNVLY